MICCSVAYNSFRRRSGLTRSGVPQQLRRRRDTSLADSDQRACIEVAGCISGSPLSYLGDCWEDRAGLHACLEGVSEEGYEDTRPIRNYYYMTRYLLSASAGSIIVAYPEMLKLYAWAWRKAAGSLAGLKAQIPGLDGSCILMRMGILSFGCVGEDPERGVGN